MTEEATWLADYVERASDEAFRKLVECYLPLVFSAALRRLGGDAHLAQDVAQQVFVDFARKARKLSGDAPLGGWLHRHTCFVVSTMLRAERRRKARESRAIEMNITQSNQEPKWEEVALILDEAINQLGNEDRTAVVLRFLEQRDLCAVGKALGTSEGAAQKRVSRALEKLRAILGRRGLRLSAPTLATALAAQTVSAVPANLSALISTAALGSVAATGGFTLTALKIMAMTKIKLGLAGLLVAGVSATIFVQQQTNAKLRAQIETLRQQSQEFEQLRGENQRLAGLQVEAGELKQLREDRAELLRLRGQAAAFRKREQELSDAQAEIRRLQSARTTGAQTTGQGATQQVSAESLKPAAEWNNLGLATPTTAFETWNWAKAKGDVDALASTLVLDTEARKKAEALLASLPESVRTKYGTVERMMATMQMNTKPIVAAQVLSQDQVDADNVIVHTQWQYGDGQLGQNDWSLHHDPDGWRVHIAPGLVDKLGKGLRLGGLTESSQP